MTSIAHTTPNRQPKAQPCSICGRSTTTGKTVALFGFVGPTCYTKLAALTETLERGGLHEFLSGPVQFTPVESEDADGLSMWVWPMEIEGMKRRAERLGFNFEWHWPRTDGPATCWLNMPWTGKLRRRVMHRLEHAQLGAAA